MLLVMSFSELSFSILSSAHPFALSRICSFNLFQLHNIQISSCLFSLRHFLLSWDALELLVFPSTPRDHALSEQIALDDSSRLECPSFSLILCLFFKHLFIQMERWGRVTNEIGNWEEQSNISKRMRGKSNDDNRNIKRVTKWPL